MERETETKSECTQLQLENNQLQQIILRQKRDLIELRRKVEEYESKLKYPLYSYILFYLCSYYKKALGE